MVGLNIQDTKNKERKKSFQKSQSITEVLTQNLWKGFTFSWNYGERMAIYARMGAIFVGKWSWYISTSLLILGGPLIYMVPISQLQGMGESSQEDEELTPPNDTPLFPGFK